jgi:hypothetical protein
MDCKVSKIGQLNGRLDSILEISRSVSKSIKVVDDALNGSLPESAKEPGHPIPPTNGFFEKTLHVLDIIEKQLLEANRTATTMLEVNDTKTCG